MPKTRYDPRANQPETHSSVSAADCKYIGDRRRIHDDGCGDRGQSHRVEERGPCSVWQRDDHRGVTSLPVSVADADRATLPRMGKGRERDGERGKVVGMAFDGGIRTQGSIRETPSPPGGRFYLRGRDDLPIHPFLRGCGDDSAARGRPEDGWSENGCSHARNHSGVTAASADVGCNHRRLGPATQRHQHPVDHAANPEGQGQGRGGRSRTNGVNGFRGGGVGGGVEQIQRLEPHPGADDRWKMAAARDAKALVRMDEHRVGSQGGAVVVGNGCFASASPASAAAADEDAGWRLGAKGARQLCSGYNSDPEMIFRLKRRDGGAGGGGGSGEGGGGGQVAVPGTVRILHGAIHPSPQRGGAEIPTSNRLDHCNSLPRRSRRTDGVLGGPGAPRKASAPGCSSFDRRSSLVSSVSAADAFVFHPLNGTGSASLPATPKRLGGTSGGATSAVDGDRRRQGPRGGDNADEDDDDDSDVHASILSLISTASSVYSTAEEKHTQEIRRLKLELELAHEKINTLTMQLNANVHVVTAFEQSLSAMTHRLQKLTDSSEQKDQELNNLKTTLSQLQQQSSNARAEMMLHKTQSFNSASSSSSSASLPRFHGGLATGLNVTRTSLQSACAVEPEPCQTNAGPLSVEHHDTSSSERKNKKKSWLSSSITKAFSRKKSKDLSDAETEMSSSISESASLPNSPLLGNQCLRSVPSTPLAVSRRPFEASPMPSLLMRDSEMRESEVILQLKQQLHDKDMKLTDIRLEALSSAHQLEQLREAMSQMKIDMEAMRAENERMQNLIAEKGITDAGSLLHTNTQGTSAASSSSTSSCSSSLLKKSLILGEPSHFDQLSMDSISKDASPRYTVAVQLGPWTHDPNSNADDLNVLPRRVVISTVGLTSTTKWETLDSTVRRMFKEHVNRVDPGGGLGLSGESVLCYHVGEITRTKGSKMPELLPCGYLVGHNTTIILTLKGVHEGCLDALAFETLIPKSVLQRYVSLVSDQKRLVLCGPSGTGKTQLAGKMAEYLVVKSGRELDSGSISTFTIDSKSGRELKQYLSNIADRCQNCQLNDKNRLENSSDARELPVVIIIDNLHHVVSLEETFNVFLNFNCRNCPYIIGTMSQLSSSTVGANLQIHHNFRWVLLTTQTEPVSNFLSRFLQRRLIEHEVSSNVKSNQLGRIVEWMTVVWSQLNRFLQSHSPTADSALGTRLFTTCPMDAVFSEEWFADLWNYSIIPYLLEALRNRPDQKDRDDPGPEDPTDWVYSNYPWPKTDNKEFRLLHRLRPVMTSLNAAQSFQRETPVSPTPSDAKGNCAVLTTLVSDSFINPLTTIVERLNETADESSPQLTPPGECPMTTGIKFTN